MHDLGTSRSHDLVELLLKRREQVRWRVGQKDDEEENQQLISIDGSLSLSAAFHRKSRNPLVSIPLAGDISVHVAVECQATRESLWRETSHGFPVCKKSPRAKTSRESQALFSKALQPLAESRPGAQTPYAHTSEQV